MTNSGSSRVLLLVAVAALVAPALAQDAPKSILPDIYAPTAPAPAPVDPAPAPAPAEPGSTASDAQAAPSARPAAQPPITRPAPVPAPPPPVTGRTGPLLPAQGGYGAFTWAGSNGAFLASAMRRTTPPLASRWAQIVLRRALLSSVPTPAGLAPGEWVAVRAGLLLRMGEADGAKLLLAPLPIELYTPATYAVASRAHLAAADPLGLCPLRLTGASVSNDPVWRVARPLCAALEGDDVSAAEGFDALRRGRSVARFDIRLAERAAATIGFGRRSANIEWRDSDRLTPLRFALSAAVGGEIPDVQLETMGAALNGWAMRAPGLPVDQRLRTARHAAVMGSASAHELGALVEEAAATLEGTAFAESEAGLLRTAHVAPDGEDRLAAMEALWDKAQSPRLRYAQLLLTASAAARLAPASAPARAAAPLLESMTTAGYLEAARAWGPALADADSEAERTRAWPLLALAGAPRTSIDSGSVRDWMELDAERNPNRTRRRAQMLLAGLDGMGAIRAGDLESLAGEAGYAPAPTGWSRRLDAAARSGRVGEVVLLSAMGLQAPWARIPPAHVAAIVRAWRQVGLEDEARLFAIEALVRS